MNQERHALLDRVAPGHSPLRSPAEEYLTNDDLVSMNRRTIGEDAPGDRALRLHLSHAMLRQRATSVYERLVPLSLITLGSDAISTMVERYHDRAAQHENHSFQEFWNTLPAAWQHAFHEAVGARPAAFLLFGDEPSSSDVLVYLDGDSTTERIQKLCKIIFYERKSKDARPEPLSLMPLIGQRYGDFFFSHGFGAGYSYNPYAWTPSIDPRAGMLRLYFGLGPGPAAPPGRDYSRVIPLNAPRLRPESTHEEIRRYTQRTAEVYHLGEQQRKTLLLPDILQQCPEFPESRFFTRDEEAERLARDLGLSETSALALEFDSILEKCAFVTDTKHLLSALQSGWKQPVMATVQIHWSSDDSFQLQLRDCRPFLTSPSMTEPVPSTGTRILQCRGTLLGISRWVELDRIVYVVPEVYGRLPQTDRYTIARWIGKLTRQSRDAQETVMLIGPGRWGTTTASLGVPVSFAEISAASIVCEIEAMRDDLITDASFATHFFSDLVEHDMMYLAIQANRPHHALNDAWLRNQPNRLVQWFPNAAPVADTLRVVDVKNQSDKKIVFQGDAVLQTASCWEQRSEFYR